MDVWPPPLQAISKPYCHQAGPAIGPGLTHSLTPDLSRSTLSNALSNSYFTSSMSMSPVSSSHDNSSKRRRTEEDEFGYSRGPMDMSPQPGSASNGHSSMQQAIPKRGQRACTACRKGKNRCEGEVSVCITSLIHCYTPFLVPPSPSGPALSQHHAQHLSRPHVAVVNSLVPLAFSKNLRRKQMLPRKCHRPALSTHLYPIHPYHS